MASHAVAHVLSKLTGVKTASDGWQAKCPSHDDHVASLHISEGHDGRVLAHCHAGCQLSDVLSSVGLKFADLFDTHTDHDLIATFDYRDADGHLVYQACRFAPKEFRLRRPDGVGGWTWKIAHSVKRVPYRLPELRNMPMVAVVEGEKDADRLWSIDIPATTNANGAGKWGVSESRALKQVGVQRVVVLPDNDKPGRAHADTVIQRVRAIGLAASLILLPGLPLKGDVSDWLDAGHTRDELLAIIASTPYVVPKGAETPPAAAGFEVGDVAGVDYGAYHLTDLGAAEAFIDRYGTQIRYDHDRQEWLIWDTHFWRPDAIEQVRRMAHLHARQWQADAISIPELDLRRKIIDFAMKLEKGGAIEGCLREARVIDPVSTSSRRQPWNPNGWLLGCPNGVVDLRTGTLRDGQCDDWITQQTRPAYDAHAPCDRWLQFLSEVFDDHADLIDYVHKALGYSLTADMSEQCFFLCIGGGSNGKSIFLDTLEHVWGTYGHRANMKLFIGNGDADKFHLADLDGPRFVFAAETKHDQHMNEHVLKNFTGGETLRAERKFGHPFTFQPVGKIWLSVNQTPKIDDDSFGFWRRVRIIPFLRTFTGSTEDRTLRHALKSEACGILRWAVEGALTWQQHGLQPPSIVTQATDDYQTAEDPLNEFFADRAMLGEPDAVTSFSALFAAYHTWADEQRIGRKDRLTRRSMGHNLKRRFATKTLDGYTRYVGIRLTQRAKDLLSET